MWTDRVILTLKGIILTNVKTLNPSCGPSGSLSLKSLESKVYDDACKVMPQQNFQMNNLWTPPAVPVSVFGSRFEQIMNL